MRKAIWVAAAVAALMPGSAHAQLLATCATATPRVAPPPPTVVPWEPIRTVAGCVQGFTTTTSQTVTTTIQPDTVFAGSLGLRVRGADALWTDHAGVFVSGQLVTGEATRTFTLEPGTWSLEVYVAGPAAATAVGGFSGTVVAAAPPAP